MNGRRSRQLRQLAIEMLANMTPEQKAKVGEKIVTKRQLHRRLKKRYNRRRG